jgi:type IV secretion system protein VirB10
MTETGPDADRKVDPETLVLRGAPRRVVRFKRGVIVVAAASGAAAIFAITWLALQQPSLRLAERTQELLTVHQPTPDSLSALPKTYDEVKPPVPELGPPLPGDLGGPILDRRRSLGLASPSDRAEEDRRRRLAELALDAREAGVFFQVSGGGIIVERSAAPAARGNAATTADDLSAAAPDRPILDPERDPNGQGRKLDFLHRSSDTGIYNPHVLQAPVSPHQLMAGSIIPASLITGINSDLPGFVVAQVTENVYDTVTGSTLLIPQGARLVGAYDSVVAFGQSRALLVWHRIILPDGSSIEIDNLPATDTAGYAGLEDKVDRHTWRLLQGVVLSTLLGVGTELTLGSEESDLVQALRESTQQSVNRAGQSLVEKTLDIQPTLTVRPGWPLRVVVHKDLVLRPYAG